MDALLFFFFFAFVTIVPIPSSSAAHELLRDTEGYPVRTDTGPYYFLSGGYGLKIARTGNDACALSVAQVPNVTLGLPLTLSKESGRYVIFTDELLNIEFDGLTPSHWHVQDGYVKVGFNNDSPKGTFMFREGLAYGYAILYCLPGYESNDDEDACKYLKLVTDEDNNKLLALGDTTDSYSNLYIVFKDKGRLEQRSACTCPQRSVV